MADEAIGPFLGVAGFCEHILEEKDNVLSAIRLIDRLILTLHEEMGEGAITDPYFLSFLITFKSFGLSALACRASCTAETYFLAEMFESMR